LIDWLIDWDLTAWRIELIVWLNCQDVDEFMKRRGELSSVDAVRQSSDSTNTNVTNLSSSAESTHQYSYPSQLTSEPPVTGVSDPQSAASITTAGPTLSTDVRRGAMWRDSLFPSDFRPTPETTDVSVVETLSGRSAVTAGKPPVGKPDERGGGGKSAMAGMLGAARLGDWETSEHRHRNVDTLSAANFPHSTPPHQQQTYYTTKPLADLAVPGSSGFRYDGSSSGRRSVSDTTYSSLRGPTYDNVVANSSAMPQQQQRSASVRPPPPGGAEVAHRLPSAGPPGVDAHRLSHMWPGAPLPAHQHHVSLSHLQHLVNPEEFQYGAPPSSAEFARPCQGPTRHHGGTSSAHHGPSSAHHGAGSAHHGSSSRQQHKTHHAHKPTTTSPATTNHPGPPPLSAAPPYDMFHRIQQPPSLGYFPHQGAAAAAALPMGLHHAQMAQMAVAAAANFAGQPMPAGQAANSAMYSAAAAAAYSYLNGGGLQPFNVDINSVMRRWSWWWWRLKVKRVKEVCICWQEPIWELQSAMYDSDDDYDDEWRL